MSNHGPWYLAENLYHGPCHSIYEGLIWTMNGGKPFTSPWAYSGSYTDSVTRSGYRTPGYFSMRRAGAFVPPTSATLSLFKGTRAQLGLFRDMGAGQYYRVSEGRVWNTSIAAQGGIYATFLDTSIPMSSSNQQTSLSQKAQTRFFNKARDSSSFEGLVFSGELKESVSMISARSHALAEGIQQAYDVRVLKKTPWFDPLIRYKKFGELPRRTTFSDLLRQKSSYWSENCYGWSPLLNDIKSGAEAAADFVYRRGGGSGLQRQACGGNSWTNELTLSNAGGVGMSPFLTLYASIKRKETFEKRFGATRSLAGAMKPGEFRTFVHNLNFSWDRVLPAAWELIPYSFVADSFTNIGDMVSSLTTDTSGLFGGWSVAVYECETQMSFSNQFGGGTPQKSRYVSFSRGPWGMTYDSKISLHLPNAAGAVNLAVLAAGKVGTLSKILSAIF